MKMTMLAFSAISMLILQLTNGVPIPMRPSTRACLARLRQVQIEIRATGDILSNPHFVPECDSTGTKWRPAQCDHHDIGYCFCVNTTTGLPKNDTRSHYHTKEQLLCDNVEPGEKICQNKQREYRNFLKNWELRESNPFYYFPECNPDGTFTALQRDSINFFCVHTVSGEKIPGTDVGPGSRRPLIEVVCQAYSQQWSAYREWLKIADVTEEHDHVVTNGSCTNGMHFVECGCARKCYPGSDMLLEGSAEVCEGCKPVCMCPTGMYENNGTCITNAACLALPPIDEDHRVLDVHGSVWTEYQQDNPSDTILSYKRIEEGEFGQEGPPAEYNPENTRVQAPPREIVESAEPVEVLEEEPTQPEVETTNLAPLTLDNEFQQSTEVEETTENLTEQPEMETQGPPLVEEFQPTGEDEPETQTIIMPTFEELYGTIASSAESTTTPEPYYAYGSEYTEAPLEISETGLRRIPGEFPTQEELAETESMEPQQEAQLSGIESSQIARDEVPDVQPLTEETVFLSGSVQEVENNSSYPPFSPEERVTTEEQQYPSEELEENVHARFVVSTPATPVRKSIIAG